MSKRIRIRRRVVTVAHDAKPLFEEMSLVRHKTVGDAVGPAYWPDVFLVLGAEPVVVEDGEDIGPCNPGRFSTYTIKSVVTGEVETVYQGDIQAVGTQYLGFTIDYYSSALQKLRKYRRSVYKCVDQKGQSGAPLVLAQPSADSLYDWEEGVELPIVDIDGYEPDEVSEEGESPHTPRARHGY